MIKQLLLFKFKSIAASKDINTFFEKYKGLEKLDCLTSVDFGKNTSEEDYDKGFTYGAVAVFETKDDVNKFLEHPDHIALTDKYLDPILEDFALVEYSEGEL